MINPVARQDLLWLNNLILWFISMKGKVRNVE